MSGQYAITEAEERQIKEIIKRHDIDFENREVSIHVSNYGDAVEEGEVEPENQAEVNIYIQVD